MILIVITYLLGTAGEMKKEKKTKKKRRKYLCKIWTRGNEREKQIEIDG